MANTTTTVPMDETRQVVIEPEKPPQVRPKQYVVVQEIVFDKKTHHKGTEILLTEPDAIPFVAANQIVPLEVAIRNGIYPISKETLTEKVVEAVTGENIPDNAAEAKAEAVSSASGGKKSFLGNALRDAVLKKKAQTTPEVMPPTKIDAAKLAAIKAGGKK